MDKLVEELRSGKRKCSFPMSRTLTERALTLQEWREVSQQAADALAIAQKRVNELEAALASHNCGRRAPVKCLCVECIERIEARAALPTPEVPGESEEEMK